MKLAFNVRYLILGLLVYIIALVLNFPADQAYAYWKTSGQSSRSFTLMGIDGSVWSGQANGGVIKGQQVENIKWTFRPLDLLFGQVGVSWELQIPGANNDVQQGVTSFGLDGSVAFSSLEVHVPVELAASILKLKVLQPTGMVSMNLQDIEWDGKSLVSAKGRVLWQGAGLNLLKPVTLGDLSLVVETINDEVKGVLSDSGGPLLADGVVTLKGNARYQFNGTFASRGNQDLENALRSMGKISPDGKVKVSYTGNLPG